MAIDSEILEGVKELIQHFLHCNDSLCDNEFNRASMTGQLEAIRDYIKQQKP